MFIPITDYLSILGVQRNQSQAKEPIQLWQNIVYFVFW